MAVGPHRIARVDDLVLAIEAGDVVRAGEDDPAHAVPARRFVEVVHADDVGLQDRLERPFDRDAAEVDDRVARRRAARAPRPRPRARRGITSSPAPAGAMSAMSLAGAARCAGARSRGRSTRPRPPAAPVSSSRPKAGTGAAVSAGSSGAWKGQRGLPFRRAGPILLSNRLRVVVQHGQLPSQSCQASTVGVCTEASLNALPLPRRRPRTLAHRLVESLGDRIRDGRLPPGAKLPTEAALMAEFGVSRTVIREAISKLQASGAGADAPRRRHLRHRPGRRLGVFRIAPDQLATLHDVVAMLELRIGVETEAAGLAAQRRSDDNLAAMRDALDAFTQAVEAGSDAVGARLPVPPRDRPRDPEPAFRELDGRPSARGSFRAPGSTRRRARPTRSAKPTCAASTPSTAASSTPSKTRTARRRARRCARTSRTAASGGDARRWAAAAEDQPRLSAAANLSTKLYDDV